MLQSLFAKYWEKTKWLSCVWALTTQVGIQAIPHMTACTIQTCWLSFYAILDCQKGIELVMSLSHVTIWYTYASNILHTMFYSMCYATKHGVIGVGDPKNCVYMRQTNHYKACIVFIECLLYVCYTEPVSLILGSNRESDMRKLTKSNDVQNYECL